MKIEIEIKGADERRLKELQKRFQGASRQELFIWALRYAHETLVPDQPFCVFPHSKPGKIGLFPMKIVEPKDPVLHSGKGILAIYPGIQGGKGILTKQKVTGLKTFDLCKIASVGKGGLGRGGI